MATDVTFEFSPSSVELIASDLLRPEFVDALKFLFAIRIHNLSWPFVLHLLKLLVGGLVQANFALKILGVAKIHLLSVWTNLKLMVA
jgi:hypothetical protein